MLAFYPDKEYGARRCSINWVFLASSVYEYIGLTNDKLQTTSITVMLLIVNFSETPKYQTPSVYYYSER
jgi:hypothetical protein